MAWHVVVLLAVAVLVAVVVGAVLGGPGVRGRVQWAAFGLVFPPAVLWRVWRWASGRASPMGQPRETPVPVAPVRVADLEGVSEPVTACPECGHFGVRPPGIADGVWPGGGEMIGVVCPRCAYRGLPLEFARREDYATFLRGLQDRANPTP